MQFTATEQFAGAWLKIVKTKGGQPAGLARYIPVGKAEFSAANGSATYAGGDFASQIVCRAAMPDGTTGTAGVDGRDRGCGRRFPPRFPTG